jgi:FtsP/CotA-like multicopper oxidase with cupredoxin domain
MFCFSLATVLLVRSALVPDIPTPLPSVVIHDNRQPAGSLRDGALTIELRARAGVWRPEGEAGRAIRIEAFGESSSAPSVPAPLIRVREGATIAATVRNDLDHPLRVHGLCDRSESPCAPLDVPAGQSRQVTFRSGPAGTYHYWATTIGMPLPFRASDDTQLSGAFIVDPRDRAADPDRIFVITEWTSITRDQLRQLAAEDDPGAAFLKLRPDVLFLINGRSWPETERLTYQLGDRVRWRVINLSTQIHPMHLHGFYFDVDSLGDGLGDQALGLGQQPSVVTQLMQPGTTMGMTWTPERAGNWLFHCHVMTHVSPSLHVDGTPKATDGHEHHASAGMTGMVLGVTVLPRPGTGARHRNEPEGLLTVPGTGTAAPRKLTLVMRTDPGRFGDAPAFGFQLAAVAASSQATPPLPVPGPLLVLTRGEPVEITLVNNLPEATAIHWHGMELDSYYDGVHGFGGMGLRVTPLVEPGDSFVVRFTPPRAGTFMYHTHLHDHRQLTSGLYGAMLVVEPDKTFDEATDHVFVIGRDGPQAGAPVAINGMRAPVVVWRAGTRHRIRLINSTPDDILSVSLRSGEGAATWRPLTKDGAPVPDGQSKARPAQQITGVGETYDFEFETPPGRQTLWLEVRSPGGKWQAQGRVIVK